jgi:hypothetical protein
LEISQARGVNRSAEGIGAKAGKEGCCFRAARSGAQAAAPCAKKEITLSLRSSFGAVFRGFCTLILGKRAAIFRVRNRSSPHSF